MKKYKGCLIRKENGKFIVFGRNFFNTEAEAQAFIDAQFAHIKNSLK